MGRLDVMSTELSADAQTAHVVDEAKQNGITFLHCEEEASVGQVLL
jgi:hypothetical protein